jgi:hypothetical protein
MLENLVLKSCFDYTFCLHNRTVLSAPQTFFAGADAAGAFGRYPPEYLHMMSVGIIKKSFELVLEYIRGKGTVRALNTLNRRAKKLNLFIWGSGDYGVVKFKSRPRGITKTSRLPGQEYWCLIWFLVFSIGDSDAVIEDTIMRRKVVKALIACL